MQITKEDFATKESLVNWDQDQKHQKCFKRFQEILKEELGEIEFEYMVFLKSKGQITEQNAWLDSKELLWTATKGILFIHRLRQDAIPQ